MTYYIIIFSYRASGGILLALKAPQDSLEKEGNMGVSHYIDGFILFPFILIILLFLLLLLFLALYCLYLLPILLPKNNSS